MPGVLHIVAAALKPEAGPDVRAAALDHARALREAERVRAVLGGMSDTQIVVGTWLPDRAALEPFAASPAHMGFVMRGLAPAIERMWSAAVETDAPPPAERPAALWAFALRASDTMFEWQVRDLLDSVARLPGAAAGGPTVEERERYRAGGLVCADSADALGAALEAARGEWGEAATSIDEALVPWSFGPDAAD